MSVHREPPETAGHDAQHFIQMCVDALNPALPRDKPISRSIDSSRLSNSLRDPKVLPPLAEDVIYLTPMGGAMCCDDPALVLVRTATSMPNML